VPLFQAEGLTVRGESTRYTPLFFSKDDLDIALRDAFLARDDQAQADARAKAQRAKEELSAAQVELNGASGDRAKKTAQKKVEAATKRLETYEKRLVDATAKKAPPRVDIGSLEEVLAKMEADEKGEWGDVLFVPAGALAQQDDNGK
jgi:glycosylphosphatidylinositol transamidase (GPIT) subunit GPI8